MKVDILGTKYKIVMDAPEEMLPEDADGAMDQSLKRIVIAKFVSDRNSIKNLDDYGKKVLRHEIIHAFLYESGLWNNSSDVTAWGQSEEIADWMAIQSPKLFKAFKDAGAL